MAVKDGKAAKLALKLLNVTSETHRKESFQLLFLPVSSCFLLFPPAAAPAPTTCYFFCSKRHLQKGVS